MVSKDDYIKNVVMKGDEGSVLLAQKFRPTLRNSELVDVLQEGMNGVAVLRIPRDHVALVHSSGGYAKEKDVELHAASVVYRLVEQARAVGAVPVAMGDVIDSNSGDLSLLEDIADAMVVRANMHGVAVVNGENAILGERVRDANVSGTMVSIVPKSHSLPSLNFGSFVHNGVIYSVFDPEGLPVHMNSDGVGTKTEFYERAGNYERAGIDWLEMDWADAMKLGAKVKAFSGVMETRGRIPAEFIQEFVACFGKEHGIITSLQHEDVGDRIRGYKPEAPAFNISGTAVSVIDEERLTNPLVPKDGDCLVGIRGRPNARSNGITAKRKKMVEMFGLEWHTDLTGKKFLPYLSEPSTLLSPFFEKLEAQGLATAFYHLSGGAYDGKLARPLAKHGLYVRIAKLFEPDPREWAFVDSSYKGKGLPSRDVSQEDLKAAFGKSPMGTDGFVATRESGRVIQIASEFGLEGMVAGNIERNPIGLTGVDIRKYGHVIYFDGRDKK